jgi:hypothetical protein
VYSGLAAGVVEGVTVLEGVKDCVTVGEMDPEGEMLVEAEIDGDVVGEIVPEAVVEAVTDVDTDTDGLDELLAEFDGLLVSDGVVEVVGEPEMLLLREALAVLEVEGVREFEVDGLEEADELIEGEPDGELEVEGEPDDELEVEGETDDELDVEGETDAEVVGEVVKEGLVEVDGVGEVDGGIM